MKEIENYKDSWIIYQSEDPRYYWIKPTRGKLPSFLEGYFTSIEWAKNRIDLYIQEVLTNAKESAK